MFTNCFPLTPRRSSSKSKTTKTPSSTNLKTTIKKRSSFNQIAPEIKSKTKNAKNSSSPVTKPLYNVRNKLNSDRFKPIAQQNNINKKKPLQRLPRSSNKHNFVASSTRSAQDLYSRRFSQQANFVKTEPKRIKSCGSQPTQTGRPAPLSGILRTTPKYKKW